MWVIKAFELIFLISWIWKSPKSSTQFWTLTDHHDITGHGTVQGNPEKLTDIIQIHEGFKSNKNNVNVILTSDNSTGIITFLSCEEVIVVPSATAITEWHTHPLPGLKMPALEITSAWTNFLLHHAHFCNEQMSSHMRV